MGLARKDLAHLIQVHHLLRQGHDHKILGLYPENHRVVVGVCQELSTVRLVLDQGVIPPSFCIEIPDV